jgi:2-keto-4-pentenoate hydratase/2-oxohepta-3-ene-1,7-dioic acid hydratase in catechol pathway
MKYCFFQSGKDAHYGLIESVGGIDHITRQILTPPEEAGDLEDLHTRRLDAIPLAEAVLLAPVRPSKIVCVGRNYREHANELGNEVPKEPLLFFKPPSALNHPGGTIVRPRVSQRTDFEGELGIVIGRRCSKLADTDDVRPWILGYTAVDDFTARDLQKKDVQFTRGKGFDTFCPVGPLVTNEIDPWAGVGVQTRVNGELKQNGNTRDLIFPVDIVIRYISNIMTLEPGDLIATGTPEGVGPVVAGDVVEVTVEGVGALRNPITDQQ